MSLPKVVLVTGSSAGGIGGALCEEYARAGCIVYASARKLESLEGLAQTGEIRKIQLDVNDVKNVEEVVKTIIDAEGRIDILVNNAGVLAVGPVLDVSIDEVKAAFETNFFSLLRLTQIVVPHMAASSATDTKGLVVNIGSITALVPIPWGGIYAATKAAIKSISEIMHMEFGPLGVKVLLVEPGGIRSNLSTNYAPKYSLPSTSLYKDYIDSIIARIHVSQQPGAMDTNEFARTVVKASDIPPILSSSSKAVAKYKWNPKWYLLAGKNTTLFWLLTWLPRTMVLRLMWRRQGGGQPKKK
ncbi:NAD-binding protein [Clavulina sp. PMI_390]|nr:NAD-binding protein [Clavulina sp. PMI_390]